MKTTLLARQSLIFLVCLQGVGGCYQQQHNRVSLPSGKSMGRSSKPAMNLQIIRNPNRDAKNAIELRWKFQAKQQLKYRVIQERKILSNIADGAKVQQYRKRDYDVAVHSMTSALPE